MDEQLSKEEVRQGITQPKYKIDDIIVTRFKKWKGGADGQYEFSDFFQGKIITAKFEKEWLYLVDQKVYGSNHDFCKYKYKLDLIINSDLVQESEILYKLT